MKTIVTKILVLTLLTTAHLTHAALRDNGDGTVTDTTSTLTWQQCTAPLSGTNCTTGTATTYYWDAALAYCNGLTLANQSDWRLPNVKELHSIVDLTKASGPTINLTSFPGTPAAKFWTSTTFRDTPIMAWYITFAIDITMTSPLTKNSNLINVRCVRGG